ncbi:MAG: hypothetical protein ACRDYU_13535, partial [Actinomycetes bacterium]
AGRAYAQGGAVRLGVAGAAGQTHSIGIAARGMTEVTSVFAESSRRMVERLGRVMNAAGRAMGGLGAVIRFAKAHRGDPYGWGKTGRHSFDCSGFVSALVNVAMGRYPFRRLGSTGNMPWPMMARGPGPFSIGWFTGSPGHTAATVNGVNMESRGGDGVVVGSAARGAGSFPNVYHLKPGLIRGGAGADAPFGGKVSSALSWLIGKESGGRTTARNPSSTAFGIGQLLLANRRKYAARLGVGPWTTSRSAQLSMMRMYIGERYSTVGNAVAHWRRHHWYGRGGRFRAGQTIGVGDRGPELLRFDRPGRVFSPEQSAGIGGPIVLEFRGDGSGYSEFLAREVRKLVRVKGGGNVQLAFGYGSRAAS